MKTIRRTVGLLGAVWLAACAGEESPEPPPVDRTCEPGEVEPCYEGPAGTEGQGACHAGVRACTDQGSSTAFGACEGQVLPATEACNAFDDDCDGEADEGLVNACGGCATLAGRRDAPCGTCGTLVCDGADALRCDEPASCGGCGPGTPGVGEACQSAEGCAGVGACQGASVVCDAQAKNECGVCGGPAVPGVGDACGGGGACPGVLVCDAAGTGTTCEQQATNVCGVCAPASQDPGPPCTDGEGCPGTWASGAAQGDPMVCSVPAGGCGGPPPALVISELSVAGAVADDEFVELHNPTDAPVDLSTWAIHYKSATGSSFSKRNLTGTIPARGYFLIARSAYAGPVAADLVQGSIAMATSGGNVGITSHQDAIADFAGTVDHVAWGTGNAPEGTAAPAPPANGSLERKATAASTPESLAAGGAEERAGNAHDSNDNAADFVVQPVRTPQNAASGTEP